MLVSHTFVADKMDKDRPGPPALDDNMEEEVPSTSVVQEQVGGRLGKRPHRVIR